MTDADEVGFVAALAELASLKPGANLTPQAYVAWWNSMRGDWTLDEFRAACAHLRDAMEFMPNPYHFNQLRKASRPTAGEAWNKAIASCRTAWTPTGFRGGTSGDPLIDQAVRALGGYSKIAQCDDDSLHWLEKRFAEIYESMQDAEDVRGALPQIAGPSQVPKLNGPRKVGDLLPQLQRPT